MNRVGKSKMSRKDYEGMVERGRKGYPKDHDHSGDGDGEGSVSPSNSKKDLAQGSGDADEQREASASGRRSAGGAAEGSRAGSRQQSGERDAGLAALSPRSGVAMGGSPGFKVVRGQDLGRELIPQAPSTPRPAQPVAASARRLQLKR